jgi:uncharacterized membrane protein
MIEIIPNWHPLFVHFPIAFATAAVFFMAIEKTFKVKPWATQCLIFGRWMLWAAALFTCVAAVFGWLAYNSVEHDAPSHAAMMLHRNWALATLAALSVLAAWDFWRGRSGQLPSGGLVFLLGVVWLLLISTAWHGGELVYRYGIGVMSLPKSKGGGHIHARGQAHNEMPAQGEIAPQDSTHHHVDEVNSEPSGDGKLDHEIPAINGANTPQKTGHTHALGTPPHKD